MRVPWPPAITTAASFERGWDIVGTLAGAPGFEPGITGPKPVALPLGYAPVNREAECTPQPGCTTRRVAHHAVSRHLACSSPIQKEHGERDHRECDYANDGEKSGDDDHDGNKDDHEL
jgi:hypothetical protein